MMFDCGRVIGGGGQALVSDDFIGNTWYVAPAALGGSNSNNGQLPNYPFLTITYAITQAEAGDRIFIAGGTYAENVTVNKDHLSLLGQVYVIINGTLTITSDYNTIDTMVANPTAAAGIVLSGNYGILRETRAGGVGGTPTNGYEVTGFNNLIEDSYSVGYSGIGYDIASGNTVINGIAVLPTGAAQGFRVNAGVSGGCLLENCKSVGNSISGYEVQASVESCVIKDCSSGSGDGSRIDNGASTTWPGYSFDDEITKVITFAGDSIHNIFKVTGAVRLSDLFGVVTTTIPVTSSNLHIDLYSTNGTVDITDAPGVDISGVVAGALIVRNTISTDNIDLANPDGTPAAAEVLGPGATNPPSGTSIDIVEDDSADTYVRVNCSASLASGAIQFYCKYRPLGMGFLEPA